MKIETIEQKLNDDIDGVTISIEGGKIWVEGKNNRATAFADLDADYESILGSVKNMASRMTFKEMGSSTNASYLDAR